MYSILTLLVPKCAANWPNMACPQYGIKAILHHMYANRCYGPVGLAWPAPSSDYPTDQWEIQPSRGVP